MGKLAFNSYTLYFCPYKNFKVYLKLISKLDSELSNAFHITITVNHHLCKFIVNKRLKHIYFRLENEGNVLLV